MGSAPAGVRRLAVAGRSRQALSSVKSLQSGPRVTFATPVTDPVCPVSA
jgi:hypothetical protein